MAITAESHTTRHTEWSTHLKMKMTRIINRRLDSLPNGNEIIYCIARNHPTTGRIYM